MQDKTCIESSNSSWTVGRYEHRFGLQLCFIRRMDDERPQYECPTSGIGHCPAKTGVEEASARHSGARGCATRHEPRARWTELPQVWLSPACPFRSFFEFNVLRDVGFSLAVCPGNGVVSHSVRSRRL